MTTIDTQEPSEIPAHDVPEGEVRFFALGILYKAPENVRKAKSAQMSDDELEASIESQGLISPLLVYEDEAGRGAVVAGGRRLSRLNVLKARHLLTDESPIPCVVRKKADAVQLSLAENIIRAPMHPADEFVAYQTLVKSGLESADIAVRYGQSKAHVDRVLCLASVHRTLFAAFRRDELSLTQVIAYAAINNKKQQKAVFDLLGCEAGERRIRAAMTEGLEASDSAQARFVTLEAYLAAGGAVREDMFTNKHYLCDLDLLMRLAVEKLEIEAEPYRQEGWGWIEVKTEHHWQSGFDRIYAEHQDVPDELTDRLAVLDDQINDIYHDEDSGEDEDQDGTKVRALEQEYEEIERRIDREYSQFDEAEKAIAGCVVTIAHDGQLRIERGLVKPDDAQRLKALQRGVTISETPTDSDDTAPATPALSKALMEDLGLIRRGAIRASLAQNHQVAHTVLYFQLVDAMVQRHRGHYYRLSGGSSIIDMNTSGVSDTVSIETTQSERWERERCTRVEALDLAWADDEDVATRFEAFCALSKTSVRALVAVAVSESLELGTAPVGQTALIDAVAEQHLQVDFAKHYRPCSELYFSRMTKAMLLELGVRFWGEGFVDECKSAKKPQIVARVAAFFASDDSVLNGEQRIQRDQWVPDCMATHG